MLKLQRNKLDQKGKILRLIESNLIYQNVVVRGGLRGCFFSMSLSMSIIFFLTPSLIFLFRRRPLESFTYDYAGRNANICN